MLSIDLEDTFGIADTKINIGRVYLKSNRPILARKNIEKGISIAKSIEADDLEIEAYEVLIDCDIFDKDYKSAFITQELLIALRDSVYSIDKVNTINELQEKYESEKKEQRISLLETENELKDSEVKQKRMQNNGMIGFAAIVVLIAIIISYYLRKTRKAKNKIEILQREIHHRVKNNLAIIRRLADVSRQNLNDESAKSAIGELIGRIESMTQVHAQLYRKTDITEVNLNSYLNELCENIHSSFSQENTQLTHEVEPSIFVDFNKAVPLGLIINELLTNAFKYAKNDEGIQILLSAKIQSDMIVIIVSDNGQGLPEGFNLQKVNSYGLKLVSGLAQQLNGSVKFYNKNGTRVEVRVPA
jgi:two-component sensor histidine kinase